MLDKVRDIAEESLVKLKAGQIPDFLIKIPTLKSIGVSGEVIEPKQSTRNPRLVSA
jgi:hypothetical protein